MGGRGGVKRAYLSFLVLDQKIPHCEGQLRLHFWERLKLQLDQVFSLGLVSWAFSMSDSILGLRFSLKQLHIRVTLGTLNQNLWRLSAFFKAPCMILMYGGNWGLSMQRCWNVNECLFAVLSGLENHCLLQSFLPSFITRTSNTLLPLTPLAYGENSLVKMNIKGKHIHVDIP